MALVVAYLRSRIVKKKYCQNCGTENKGDATRCEKCGAVFE